MVRFEKIVRRSIDGRAKFVERALPAIARSAGAIVTRAIREEIDRVDAVATGRFRRGVSATARATRQQARLVITLEAPHSTYVLRGRRAGARMPPVSAIAAWIRVRRLALNPYLVARAIARRGIRPKPVVDWAWRRVRRSVIDAARRRLLDAFFLGAA